MKSSRLKRSLRKHVSKQKFQCVVCESQFERWIKDDQIPDPCVCDSLCRLRYNRKKAHERYEELSARRFYKFPKPGKNPETRLWRCRVCKADIPAKSRRTSFCSEGCSKRYWFCTSSAAQRAAVFERDHGVCTYCGTDTVAIKERLESMPGYRKYNWDIGSTEAEHAEYEAELEKLGLKGRIIGAAGGHLWEAHHKTAVAEGGGGEITVDDLATACWKCHPKHTSETIRRLRKTKRLSQTYVR